MRNKELPTLALLDFLSLLIACVAAELLTKLVIRFSILFVELSFVSASIVRLVCLLVISVGILSFIGYKEGYRSAGFVLSEALPAMSLAAVVHYLICMLLRFTPWLAGPTRHIAGFLSLGAAYNATERIEEIPFYWLAIVGFVMAAAWTGCYLLSSYVGFRRRIRDRGLLTGNNEK
ncbi:MAG: hypothetical protein J6B12_03985 [Clostridia bacterium]|nr:hypothetical protein [Clostridia bacterium]